MVALPAVFVFIKVMDCCLVELPRALTAVQMSAESILNLTNDHDEIDEAYHLLLALI